MNSKCYVINTQGIHAENFDSEMVIVNLNVGNYYTLRGVGFNIWLALQSPSSLESLVKAFQQTYPNHSQEIAQEIKEFLDVLLKEALIVEMESTPGKEVTLIGLPGEYLTPTLEVFNDLQELFLLDPIHAVDSQLGWPFQPENKK